MANIVHLVLHTTQEILMRTEKNTHFLVTLRVFFLVFSNCVIKIATQIAYFFFNDSKSVNN